jgi:VIT1/CCC1 family predicted Fe2+/Mn2+ transporter
MPRRPSSPAGWPLAPFSFGVPHPFATSGVATGMTFCGIGARRSRWSLGRWFSALETLLIGGTAAVVSFAVAPLFRGRGPPD